MKAQHTEKTVGDLLKLKKANMLYPNPEYQRGAVWSVAQKKRLVDSVLRGYTIPLIYLHHISKEVAEYKREDFEVIDGQQRINALHDYREGNFKVFDPVEDAEEAQFPSFIQTQPCPWGGKRFYELPQLLKDQLLGTVLAIVLLETETSNEARDLFIRLQAGMPLNSQEKRDAWPGSFTEYILNIAGKPEIPRYPGHDFFANVMKAKERNRGEYRQLTAQMVILYESRKKTGKLSDVNRDAIDSFYYKNLDFDANSSAAKRFSEILDKLNRLLYDGKRKKVIGHEAMSLVLLIDSLLDDYTRSWEDRFATAFDMFKKKLAEATQSRFMDPTSEYWTRYGQWTRTNSDRGATIEQRHQFFSEKMREIIKPQLKDPNRKFGLLEREMIYYRDKKQCQAPGCNGEVIWSEAEIHHVEQHADGGRTVLNNGALVHRGCHPKGQKDVAAFAEKWRQLNQQ